MTDSQSNKYYMSVAVLAALNSHAIPEKKNYRERYKRISQSATFKRVYHNKSIGDVISVEN